MKKMTKEELIQFFLDRLGENKILEKFMSKEQIFRKLKRLISKVTYEPEKGNTLASWNQYSSGKGKLNFDISKIQNEQEEITIIHELLHVLSSKVKIEEDLENINITSKIGFRFSYWGSSDVYNTGINEGMTEYLAEKITDEFPSGYSEEVYLCRILETVFGEEVMLKRYFSDQVVKRPYDIFRNELKNRYGKEVGNELNDILRKILGLSDKFTTIKVNQEQYSWNSDTEIMKRKIMQELRATIEIFVKKVLNNEKDLKRKIDIVMGCRRTSLIEMSFYDMFYDLLHKAARSTILTYEEKLIILKKFMSSHPSFFIYDNISIITEFYLGCGKISGDVFDKREWLEDIIKYLRPKTIEEIDNILEDIYYERLGDICRICESEENDIHFTDDIVSVHDKYFAKFEFGTINDTILDRKLPKKMRGISNEIVEKILSEIKNIMAVEGYDKFRLIIIREVNYISDDYNILEQRTDFIKDYRIRIIDDERQVDNIYIINEDGTLQLLEVGEKRRFTDDMSELDIKLKEQTEDVSVIEMIEGANDLQMALKLDERVSEESSRGEEEND